MDVTVVDDLRPREQLGAQLAGQRKGGGIETARRDRAKVDDLGPAGAGGLDDHEADPAEAAVPRLDRGKRKCGGDDGVDRVAPCAQHLRANLGRGPVLRRDNPAPRGDARLADVPILRQVHVAEPVM